jgi:hypothetical protein
LLRPDAQQFEKSLLGRGLKESFQMWQTYFTSSWTPVFLSLRSLCIWLPFSLLLSTFSSLI